jgi:hypothetical protein
VHVVFVEFVVGGSDAGCAQLAQDLAPVDWLLLLADELSVEGEVGGGALLAQQFPFICVRRASRG